LSEPSYMTGSASTSFRRLKQSDELVRPQSEGMLLKDAPLV
jgi:hypothetical protein